MGTAKWATCPEIPFFRGRGLIHSLNKHTLSISYVAGMVLASRGLVGSKPSPDPCPQEACHLVGGRTLTREQQVTQCMFPEGKVSVQQGV